ncbi:MAG: hypothetical protein U1F77_10610 [Kiritimatiellia bacterium]
MNRLLMLLSAATLAVSVRAAPVNPADVAADARWVVHADLDSFKGTELGKYMKGKLVDPRVKDKLAAFRQMFQFDPAEDIASVTLYGSSRREEDGIALFRGAFKGETLVTLLKANDSYKSRRENGLEIHSWIDGKKDGDARTFGAILDDRVVILGRSGDLVARAAAVVRGKAGALNPANAAIDLPQGAPAFFAAAANLQDLGVNDPRAAMVKDIVAGSIVVGEQAGQMQGTLSVTTRTPEAAAQMNAMLSGLLAMAQMNREKKPELATLAQRVQPVVDGSHFKVSMSFPVREIIGEMEKHVNVDIRAGGAL